MSGGSQHIKTGPSPMSCPVHLDDVDLFGEGAQEHWYDAYEILHRDAPVLRIADGGHTPGQDAFVLTKHADIERVVRDPERFISMTQRRVGSMAADGVDAAAAYEDTKNMMTAAMVTLRPTQALYTTHRKELTDPWVGTGAKRHREMIAAHAHALIDEWIDDDHVEFVSQFARPLPQRVMATVLGLPLSDIPQMAEWGDAVVTPFVHGDGLRHTLDAERTETMLARLDGFQDYIYDHVRTKRAAPQDDMISFLCGVHYEALDRTLTDLEIAGIVHAMIIGGLETTQYALEEQVQLLCEHPGMFDRLRADRGLVRAFTEEAMRLRSPTQGLSTRVTAHDEVFSGVDVPAGSLLHLRFGAANVDGDAFDHPRELTLDRAALTRHLAFSAGPRVCPGANLSRIEQQTAWNALLDRLSAVEYADGNDWQHQPGIMLGTLEVKLRPRVA